MMSTDLPRRSSRRPGGFSNPLVSLRSPLPLIAAAIGITLLLIAVVTLPPRPPAVVPDTPALAEAEVLSLVAHDMRSGDAAARVLSEGQVRFDDGTWYVSVGGAHFHFSQRNRIVIADDPPAIQLQYRS